VDAKKLVIEVYDA
jgi:hypothetical protein